MNARDNCPEDALSAYIDGELTDAERVTVGAHLGSCSACRETVEDLRRLAAATTDEAVPPVPAGLAARISEGLDAEGEQVADAEAGAARDEPVAPPVSIATGRKTPRRQPVRRGWVGPPLAAAAALAMAAVVWTAWQSGSGSGLEPDLGPTFIASQQEAPVTEEADPAKKVSLAEKSVEVAGPVPQAEESAGDAPARDDAAQLAGSDRDADSSRGRRQAVAPALNQKAENESNLGTVGAAAGKGAASSPLLPPPPPSPADVLETAEPEGELRSKPKARNAVPALEPESRLEAKKTATAPGDAKPLQKEDVALESAAAFADVAGSEEQKAQVLDEMAADSADSLRAPGDAQVARAKATASSLAVAPASSRVLAVRTPDGVIELTSGGLLKVTTGESVCRTLWDGAAVSAPTPGESAVAMQADDRVPADLQAALAEVFMLAELGATNTQGAKDTSSNETTSGAARQDAMLNAPVPESAPDPGGAAVSMWRDDGTVAHLEADADTARLVARLREKLTALMNDHYRAGLDDACGAVQDPLP